MCCKPRGHKPDQNQCCKTWTCDCVCWASTMPTVLLGQTPKMSRFLYVVNAGSMSENHGVPVLYCSPWRTPVSLSPGREQVANIVGFFFLWHYSVSLGYSESSFPVLLSPTLALNAEWPGFSPSMERPGGSRPTIHPFDHLSLLPLCWVDPDCWTWSEGVLESRGIVVSDFPTLSACGRIYLSSFW